MNKIVFFAQIRELIDTDSLMIDAQNLTIEALLTQLSLRGDKWSLALKERTVLCAVNKSLVDYHYVLKEGDEIAFFPPVTGG